MKYEHLQCKLWYRKREFVPIFAIIIVIYHDGELSRENIASY